MHKCVRSARAYGRPRRIVQKFANEIGKGVTGHHVGDRVFAMQPFMHSLWRGTYAEYARIDASLVATSPKNIDAVTSAAVPLAALTAY